MADVGEKIIKTFIPLTKPIFFILSILIIFEKKVYLINERPFRRKLQNTTTKN